MRLDIALAMQRAGFTLELDQTLELTGITAVMGASGSGKSTLLRALAGLETPQRARIALGGALLADSAAGVSLPPHRRGNGYVFQDARLFGHRRVLGNLRYAQARARPANGGTPAPALDEVIAALDLNPLLERRTQGLSGGERQRVAIARAIVLEPEFVVADEPTSMLDATIAIQLFQLLTRIRDEFNMTFLFITHNLAAAKYLCDRVAVIHDGHIVEVNTAQKIIEQPEHPYTKKLIDVQPGFDFKNG
ncbi:MAG TPA: ABC transporter ATP-binding protein [Gammaproteobacteria bacterium]|nr:ABC transporter ATP-binding protein [Gammaproteobacteria bacterium]